MIPAKPSVDLAVLGLSAGEPATVRARAPTLLFTIESSIARIGARGATHILDRAGCLVVPAGEVLTIEASGPASRVAALGLHEPVLAAVEVEHADVGLDRRRLDRWLRRRALLPRTVWLHELAHRYVFERHALGAHRSLASRFLEIELVKEIYFLFRDREAGAERASNVRAYSPPIERALRHIEAHLFDECTVAALARIGGASPSTLRRLFRAEVGCTPGAYWRNRKLDEALIALRGGRSVAEVAARVGYENPTAFGFAFRRRFGRPPSAFRPTAPARPAP